MSMINALRTINCCEKCRIRQSFMTLLCFLLLILIFTTPGAYSQGKPPVKTVKDIEATGVYRITSASENKNDVNEAKVYIPRYGSTNAYFEQIYDQCVIDGINANKPGFAGWFVQWDRYQPSGPNTWNTIESWLVNHRAVWEACAASDTVLIVKPWISSSGVPSWARACGNIFNWCNYPGNVNDHINFMQTLVNAMKTIPGLKFVIGAWNEVDLRWDGGTCNTGQSQPDSGAREGRYNSYSALFPGTVWTGGLSIYNSLRRVPDVEYHNDAVLPWVHIPDGCSVDRRTWMRESFRTLQVKYGVVHCYRPTTYSGQQYADEVYPWVEAMNAVTGPEDLNSPHYPPRFIVGEASPNAGASPPLSDPQNQELMRRWYLGVWRDLRMMEQFEGLMWHGGSCASDGAPNIAWWASGPYQARLSSSASTVNKGDVAVVTVQLNKPVQAGEGPIGVGVTTVQDTAVANQDYEAGMFNVVFEEGEQYKDVVSVL